ncbi:methylosome subunit pICln isoform X1 [Lampetra fluviatilis]
MVLMLSEVALPDDGVKHQESAMSLFVNGEDAGSGVLCVAESRLAWRDAQGHGVSVEYPRVSLHAVSRDPNTFPQHHLYVMLNGKLRAEDAAGDGAKGDDEEEEDDDDDDDDDPITELRFVPRDSSSLEALFTAMCECQALHPDLDEVLSEDDIYDDDVGEGDTGNGGRQGWYGDQEGLGMLTSTGRATLAHLDGLLADASGRALSFGMGGVRERNGTEPDADGMEVDATSQIPPHGETGQFDDADDDV